MILNKLETIFIETWGFKKIKVGKYGTLTKSSDNGEIVIDCYEWFCGKDESNDTELWLMVYSYASDSSKKPKTLARMVMRSSELMLRDLNMIEAFICNYLPNE